jgi:manganese/zinc/iron transport system ATP- binding protein
MAYIMSDPLFPYGTHRHHADPVAGAPALEVRRLVAHYPGRRKPALVGVDLCVPVGGRVALVGSNGAGKSTLIKVIAGLLPVADGTVRIYGNPVGACHHRVAYLPQRGDIDWRFPVTLRKLVLGGRYVHLGWLKHPAHHDWQIVDRMIARLGLSDLGNRQIGQLSGGQQQRALIARALAQEADLLLLDEPLNAVDTETRAIIHEVLSLLKREGKTVIAATHDLSRLADDFDGALYLDHGRPVTQPEWVHIPPLVASLNGQRP